jgi:hypothetical protein
MSLINYTIQYTNNIIEFSIDSVSNELLNYLKNNGSVIIESDDKDYVLQINKSGTDILERFDFGAVVFFVNTKSDDITLFNKLSKELIGYEEEDANILIDRINNIFNRLSETII